MNPTDRICEFCSRETSQANACMWCGLWKGHVYPTTVVEKPPIAIYYCSSTDGFDLRAHVEFVEESPQQIKDLLDRMRELHKEGKLFITSASHTRDGVVQGVIDGNLPNGTPYTWMKRRTQ